VGQVLWTGIEGQKQSSHTGVTYHDGKLYRAKGVVLEALTGKVLAGNPKQRHGGATPPTHHLLLIGGGQVFGLAKASGKETSKPSSRGST